MKNLNDVLTKILDINKLFTEHPEYFSLNNLMLDEKVVLINSNPEVYFDTLVKNLHPSEKLYLLKNITNKIYLKKLEFSDEEIKKLNKSDLGLLVKTNVKKYLKVDIYNKMSNAAKVEIFLIDKNWVMNNIKEIPKLSEGNITELARQDPEFIDKNISDFSKYSTTHRFWNYMIKHDGKYRKIFLSYADTISTKTEVRSIVYSHPTIIKELDQNNIITAKLTCKEWIYLINDVMESKPLVFKDWQFSDDLAEVLKLDLTSEMLTGKSKLSTRFQNLMKKFFKKPEEAEDETQIVE